MVGVQAAGNMLSMSKYLQNSHCKTLQEKYCLYYMVTPEAAPQMKGRNKRPVLLPSMKVPYRFLKHINSKRHKLGYTEVDDHVGSLHRALLPWEWL